MNRLVSFYYSIRYNSLKFFLDFLSKRSSVYGIVLMYHHVTDEHVDTNESCQHRISLFKDTLMRFKEDGYLFVSVEEALNLMSIKSIQKFVIVTFDDVPESMYHNAYPILKELDIPFVLFITTSFIDKQGYLSRSQIIELDNDPLCTIGAHTVTHPMLRTVDNSFEELRQSKCILETLIGHSVDFMAYPFGRQSSVSRRVMKQAKLAGYRCAFATIQSPISDISSKNLFFLPRLVIK